MMDPTVVVLLAMDFVSLMLMVILVTAWSSFGRPAHALSWGAAFAVAAACWSLRVIAHGEPDAAWMESAARILSMVTWAALLFGFRQRAGLPHPGRPVAVALGATVAASLAASLFMPGGMERAIPLLFSAAMLGLSAATMMVRAGGPAERAVITMLLALAILDVAAALFALTAGPGGSSEQLADYRALMLATQPSALVGAGLFAVFLLAADLAERMSKLAASDPLTGVLNRRGFEEAAMRTLAIGRRHGQPLTVVVADLDCFKTINDRHGHAAGDAVLRRFVEHIAGSIRGGDLLGRIGGEEFAMVLVGAEPRAAAEAVDRIRAAFARLDIHTGRGVVHVTASFGLSGPSGPEDTLSDLLARADQALYRAKVDGRNRVSVAPSPDERIPPPSAAQPLPCPSAPLLAA